MKIVKAVVAGLSLSGDAREDQTKNNLRVTRVLPVITSPTLKPIEVPMTSIPSFEPSAVETKQPIVPSNIPTNEPSFAPVKIFAPSISPTLKPVEAPITSIPSFEPSAVETKEPIVPSNIPTNEPSFAPSISSTLEPTEGISTFQPSALKTKQPIVASNASSISPSSLPSSVSRKNQTKFPTQAPTSAQEKRKVSLGFFSTYSKVVAYAALVIGIAGLAATGLIAADELVERFVIAGSTFSAPNLLIIAAAVSFASLGMAANDLFLKTPLGDNKATNKDNDIRIAVSAGLATVGIGAAIAARHVVMKKRSSVDSLTDNLCSRLSASVVEKFTEVLSRAGDGNYNNLGSHDSFKKLKFLLGDRIFDRTRKFFLEKKILNRLEDLEDEMAKSENAAIVLESFDRREIFEYTLTSEQSKENLKQALKNIIIRAQANEQGSEVGNSIFELATRRDYGLLSNDNYSSQSNSPEQSHDLDVVNENPNRSNNPFDYEEVSSYSNDNRRVDNDNVGSENVAETPPPIPAFPPEFFQAPPPIPPYSSLNSFTPPLEPGTRPASPSSVGSMVEKITTESFK